MSLTVIIVSLYKASASCAVLKFGCGVIFEGGRCIFSKQNSLEFVELVKAKKAYFFTQGWYL